MTQSEIEALVADSVAALSRPDQRRLVASWEPVYRLIDNGWLIYNIGDGFGFGYITDAGEGWPWCIFDRIETDSPSVNTGCESFEDCCDAVIEKAARNARPEPPRPKATKPPKLFPINHDDYHARHIGTTDDGRRFFLTTPFVASDSSGPGCDYIALFLFDKLGKFTEARIDQLGPRNHVDPAVAQAIYNARLNELGSVTFQRIKVAPFEVQRFGTTFGFIAIPPDEDSEEWSIELHPGNYMAFYPPFTGDYDT